MISVMKARVEPIWNAMDTLRSDPITKEDAELELCTKEGNWQLIFSDSYTHRQFISTPFTIVEAKLNVNRLFCVRRRVTLNDFYGYLGLPKQFAWENLGWNTEDSLTRGYQWIPIDICRIPFGEDNSEVDFDIFYPYPPTYLGVVDD